MATPQFNPTISIQKVMRTLWTVVGVLIGIHVVLTLIHFMLHEVPWYVRQIFDVDEEDSFPTWYSATALFITAATLWVNAHAHKVAASPLRWHWFGLSVGFLLLSIDEIAGVHETLNSITEMSWAIPGAVISALVGLIYLKFLVSIDRRIAFQFVLAGIIFVGGAVGVEWFTEPYLADDKLNTLAYNLWTGLEEGMEMSGVLIFLRALLNSMKADAPFLALELKLID